MHNNQSLISKYRNFLPVSHTTPIVTLGEGNTPLVPAINLPDYLGYPDLQLYFKLEGLNPTGSFKDRGMTLAISKALEDGARGVICASTGNTSASAAAFAAKAGLSCFVLLPAEHVALGKLAQATLYGAEIIQIAGNFDQALDLVRALSTELPLTVVNSINPYRLEGQKTAAFEVIEQLGKAPDYLFIPVGNAGNICAYWRGFKAYKEAGIVDTAPLMFGFEAEGAAAIVNGEVILNPQTIASAIRIGNPASWQEASAAARESGGKIGAVNDARILEAYQLLAKYEGIFCEPSSAASLAAVIKHLGAGTIEKNASIVCVLTGNGLKDPSIAMDVAKYNFCTVPPEPAKLREAIKL